MLHDSATSTSKIGIKEQVKAKALQLYSNVKDYGMFDDTYSTKAREEAVLNSALLKDTLLSTLWHSSNTGVMKDTMIRLLRGQKELIWERLEHLKALHTNW